MGIDRPTLKLMHVVYTGHGGFRNLVMPAGQGGVSFGEVLVGVTGKTANAKDLVRLVTSSSLQDPYTPSESDEDKVPCDNSRKDTLYNFFYDMCRTQTKGTQMMVKDRHFDYQEELRQKDLLQRICQIFAAQNGIRASGNDSPVQRIAAKTMMRRACPSRTLGSLTLT